MTKKTEKYETPIRYRRPRSECPTVETGEGVTEQAHKDACDINSILHDYTRTGFMRHAKQNEGRYDDVTSVDFQNAQNIVAQVKTMFETLPSEIRQEFGQNPSTFLDYVQNPSNGKELADRGILVGNDGINIKGATSRALTKAQYKEMIAQQSALAAEVSSAPEADSSSESATVEQ